MSTDAAMVDYYAQRAQEYERIYHKPERQADLAALRPLLEQTFSGKRVLELACGTGYWTECLARSAASVLATDINEEVLQVARAKKLHPGRVTFAKLDAYHLPEFVERFNGGLAGFWWSHIPRAELRAFLARVHRVFTADATVLFLDNAYVEGSSTPIARTDAVGNTYQLRKLDDGSTHEVLKNFPNESELRTTLQGLGTNVQVRLLKYYWLVIYRPS